MQWCAGRCRVQDLRHGLVHLRQYPNRDFDISHELNSSVVVRLDLGQLNITLKTDTNTNRDLRHFSRWFFIRLSSIVSARTRLGSRPQLNCGNHQCLDIVGCTQETKIYTDYDCR